MLNLKTNITISAKASGLKLTKIQIDQNFVLWKVVFWKQYNVLQRQSLKKKLKTSSFEFQALSIVTRSQKLEVVFRL